MGNNVRTTIPHEVDQDKYYESEAKGQLGRNPYFKTVRERRSEDFMAHHSPDVHFVSLNKSEYSGAQPTFMPPKRMKKIVR